MDTVQHVGHIPRLLRTNCGTENVLLAGTQSCLHQDDKAHGYEPSTSNQLIEVLWSKVHLVLMGWEALFGSLLDDGTFVTGRVIHTYAIRMAFMELLNTALQQFIVYWNTHRVRNSADAPGGATDVLFHTTQHCGLQPVDNNIIFISNHWYANKKVATL